MSMLCSLLLSAAPGRPNNCYCRSMWSHESCHVFTTNYFICYVSCKALRAARLVWQMLQTVNTSLTGSGPSAPHAKRFYTCMDMQTIFWHSSSQNCVFKQDSVRKIYTQAVGCVLSKLSWWTDDEFPNTSVPLIYLSKAFCVHKTP